MPLFGKDKEPAQPAQAPPRNSTSSAPKSGGGIFGRRRSSSPVSPVTSPDRSSTTHSSGSGGLLNNVLHRGSNNEDPSITQARERVASAEHAEREADRALSSARTAVKEARDHVKRLEQDAAEEARLAKIKQGHAKDISKSAKGLGRHG